MFNDFMIKPLKGLTLLVKHTYPVKVLIVALCTVADTADPVEVLIVALSTGTVTQGVCAEERSAEEKRLKGSPIRRNGRQRNM